MKLSNIILLNEGYTIYKCDVLIKTQTEQNKVGIYNEIRALTGVVVVTIDHSDFLDSKKTNTHEYSLLRIKFIGNSNPKESIKKIGLDAMTENKVSGLLQFIPRYNTIIKTESY